jgi:hypothetical protein
MNAAPGRYSPAENHWVSLLPLLPPHQPPTWFIVAAPTLRVRAAPCAADTTTPTRAAPTLSTTTFPISHCCANVEVTPELFGRAPDRVRGCETGRATPRAPTATQINTLHACLISGWGRVVVYEMKCVPSNLYYDDSFGRHVGLCMKSQPRAGLHC